LSRRQRGIWMSQPLQVHTMSITARIIVSTAFAILTSIVVPRGASGVDTIHTGQLLPAERAAATMRVPEGFQVTLFAGEPHVQQPISFCLDDRGRLWVAEAFNY